MPTLQYRLLVRDHIDTLGDNNNALSALFYSHLFRLQPSLRMVFNGGVPMLNRKFNSMIATFKNIKHLEKIAAAIESMAERHVAYHIELAYFPLFRESLLLALRDLLGDAFTPELEQAWSTVFDEVASIMTATLAQHGVLQHPELTADHEVDLLAHIGGEAVVTAVHQRFYDAIYEDAFLGRFFHHRAKYLLVRKQTEFMVAAFGGPNHYRGEPPAFVHMHMFITAEMSAIRERYLRWAILSEGLSADVCEAWLNVDRSFHASIEKNHVDDCVMRCWGQMPTVVKKPEGYEPPELMNI
jgi:hemoglobin-like flavoprotein